MAKNLNADTYQSSLQGMLDALFRPVEENGYWSESEGRILRALNVEFKDGGGLEWVTGHGRAVSLRADGLDGHLDVADVWTR